MLVHLGSMVVVLLVLQQVIDSNLYERPTNGEEYSTWQWAYILLSFELVC